MNSTTTQNQQVLAYIKRYGSITPLQALDKLGVMRLGARCWELKQDGVPITKTMVKVRTREGTTRVARYSLEA